MAAKWLAAFCALNLIGLRGNPSGQARGPVEYESRAIERDASERVRVNLDMGAAISRSEQRHAEICCKRISTTTYRISSRESELFHRRRNWGICG